MYGLLLLLTTILSFVHGDNIAQESQPSRKSNGRKPADQQAAGAVISSSKDVQAAESGGGHGFGDKFFMYAHSPAHKEYEFGYRRGNDYHFQERYEKGTPDHAFKTKVRWHDKHGGYGEHYWDYNHGPSYDHGDDHGGYHSEQVETVVGQESAQPSLIPSPSPSAILYSPPAKRDTKNVFWDLDEAQSEEKKSKDIQKKRKQKKERTAQALFNVPPSLVLDMSSGHVIDERTGKMYKLSVIL